MRPEIKNELDERANGCRIGLLAVTNVTNPKTSEALEKAKSLLEEELRGKYAQIERQELRSLHPMSVYVSYYKKFGYTYHVLQGDIMITDDESVLSSILRGPDGRTSIDEETEQVLYTIYAPTGIDEKEIISHMDDIESYVRLFSPGSNLELKTVI